MLYVPAGPSQVRFRLQQWESVAQVVMEYIAMLREEGPQAWVYQECKEVNDMSFRFVSKQSPFGYCTSLASSMLKYSPKETVSGPYLMKDYDPDAITL